MLIHADIVVVGGGMAGFSAAMAAAQENKKVILIEKSNQLGGNATNANVGTICGAYYRTFAEKPKLIGYKFCKDFISNLLAVSDKNKLINYHNGLFIVSYDWKYLADYIEQQLIEAGVEILKNAEITQVKQEGNLISQFTINLNEKVIELYINSIVDCSGNGIVSQLAQAEMISDTSYQSASQIFCVKNIISDNEYSLNMALKKVMTQLVVTHQWPKSFKSLSIVPGSLNDNRAHFKITLPNIITDKAEQKNQLSIKAKEYIHEVFPCLTKNIESLKNAEVEFVFPEVGVRIQQRSKGKEILYEEDVLSCKKTPYGIAIATWPIEEWNEDGKLSMQYFNVDDCYTISANCLQSNSIDNLYFAGKNISATTKAIASARVIGTCLQTGYAAGKLAICQNKIEKEKMILSLHNELFLGND
ncbi:MAG: FAD-dependent oxidoreductase [Bacteroidia bacterium]